MRKYKSKLLWTQHDFLIRSRLPSGPLNIPVSNNDPEKLTKLAELARVNRERVLHRDSDPPIGSFRVGIESKEVTYGARYSSKSARRFCNKCDKEIVKNNDPCGGSHRTTIVMKKEEGERIRIEFLPNFRIIFIYGEIIDLENIMKRPDLYSMGTNRKYSLLSNATHYMLANEANECDDRGHLIAASLGGPNCHFNLVPQPVVINQNNASLQRVTGCYYEVEDKIRAVIKSVNPKSSVARGFMRVDLVYRDDDVIPYSFKLSVRDRPGSATIPIFFEEVINLR